MLNYKRIILVVLLFGLLGCHSSNSVAPSYNLSANDEYDELDGSIITLQPSQSILNNDGSPITNLMALDKPYHLAWSDGASINSNVSSFPTSCNNHANIFSMAYSANGVLTYIDKNNNLYATTQQSPCNTSEILNSLDQMKYTSPLISDDNGNFIYAKNGILGFSPLTNSGGIINFNPLTCNFSSRQGAILQFLNLDKSNQTLVATYKIPRSINGEIELDYISCVFNNFVSNNNASRGLELENPDATAIININGVSDLIEVHRNHGRLNLFYRNLKDFSPTSQNFPSTLSLSSNERITTLEVSDSIIYPSSFSFKLLLTTNLGNIYIVEAVPTSPGNFQLAPRMYHYITSNRAAITSSYLDQNDKVFWCGDTEGKAYSIDLAPIRKSYPYKTYYKAGSYKLKAPDWANYVSINAAGGGGAGGSNGGWSTFTSQGGNAVQTNINNVAITPGQILSIQVGGGGNGNNGGFGINGAGGNGAGGGGSATGGGGSGGGGGASYVSYIAPVNGVMSPYYIMVAGGGGGGGGDGLDHDGGNGANSPILNNQNQYGFLNGLSGLSSTNGSTSGGSGGGGGVGGGTLNFSTNYLYNGGTGSSSGGSGGSGGGGGGGAGASSGAGSVGFNFPDNEGGGGGGSGASMVYVNQNCYVGQCSPDTVNSYNYQITNGGNSSNPSVWSNASGNGNNGIEGFVILTFSKTPITPLMIPDGSWINQCGTAIAIDGVATFPSLCLMGGVYQKINMRSGLLKSLGVCTFSNGNINCNNSQSGGTACTINSDGTNCSPNQTFN